MKAHEFIARIRAINKDKARSIRLENHIRQTYAAHFNLPIDTISVVEENWDIKVVAHLASLNIDDVIKAWVDPMEQTEGK